jgi:predicted MPP superfamily phosphohydrolase
LIVFLGVIVSILGSVHWYLWRRLLVDTDLPASWQVRVGWLMTALVVSIPTAIAVTRTLPPGPASPLIRVPLTWLGIMFLLFILVLGMEVPRVAALVSRWLAGGDGLTDPGRRLFLERSLAAAATLGAFGLGTVGIASAVAGPTVKRVRVPLAGWPSAWEGMTVVQVSDVHVGHTIGRAFLDDLVARVNALQPDVIAITGDLVDGTVEHLGDAVAALGALNARHGVYFVTGNHEYYAGVEPWLTFLSDLGIRVLRNERVTLDRAGSAIDLAGIDDLHGGDFGRGHGADLPRALANRDPQRPVILLAHQPKAVLEAARHGVTLQLSGHTHGGQMFPFSLLVRLQQPYVSGLHRHEGTWIYVSRGTGFWGPPMRVGAPAEITHLTLTGTSPAA